MSHISTMSCYIKDPHSHWFEDLDVSVINNGNRTAWSPIRSVIIQVINKIGRSRIITITISEKQKILIGKKLLIAMLKI